MKAIIVKELGDPQKLTYGDMSIGAPGPDRVIIEVKYAGVNFPDTLIIRGKYQFQPDLPFVPGGEVAGIIKEVGEGVEEFKPGDRVVSGTTWGAFAEEVQGFAFNTHKLPDGVNFKDGATVLMTHGTVMHALKDRAGLKEGQTLAVLGAAGGVGTAAIQLGKAMGSRVIACVSSEEKLQYCKSLGADVLHLYTPQNIKQALKDYTGGHGPEVIFDAVGGDYAEPAFRAIAPMGTYLVVGFASGRVPAIPWNLPLLKSASITGVFWGNFFRNYSEQNKANVQELLSWVENHRLKPVVDEVFPLEKGAEALMKIENRAVKGKVLIKVGE